MKNLASNSFVEILKDNNVYITDVKYKLNEDFFNIVQKKYMYENIFPGVFWCISSIAPQSRYF